MSDTTKEKVLTLAPELTSITDDDLWTMILEDVALQVTYSAYGVNEERAQRYLAAHLLTLHLQAQSGLAGASGGLTETKTGDVSAKYGNVMSALNDVSRYDMTSYGRQFKLIQMRIAGPRVYTPYG